MDEKKIISGWLIVVNGRRPSKAERLTNAGLKYDKIFKRWMSGPLTEQQAKCMAGRFRSDDIDCLRHPTSDFGFAPVETVKPKINTELTRQELKKLRHAHRLIDGSLIKKDECHRTKRFTEAKSKPRPT